MFDKFNNDFLRDYEKRSDQIDKLEKKQNRYLKISIIFLITGLIVGLSFAGFAIYYYYTVT